MEQEFTEFSEFTEFGESHKSLKHDWAQLKDPVSHMCLASAVIASWSLTREVAGWQGGEPFYCTDKYFCH